MNRKLRELFHFEFPEDGGSGGESAPVPGTGEVTPVLPDDTPPAEANNTEESQRDLGPIPYSRFKEVNERRRALEDQIQPFVDLEAAGYGAEDLHRLAAWEREYQQDPVGVWLRQAAELELPDPVKAAIMSLQDNDGPKDMSEADPTPPVKASESAANADDDPPAWARPLIEEHQSRRAAEEQQAIDGVLDALTSAWTELDQGASIKSPSEQAMLRYIQTSAGKNSAEILRSAREAWLADREEVLAGEVKPPGDGGTVPRSVPGSGAGSGSAPPVVARSLKEATRQALSAIERTSS